MTRVSFYLPSDIPQRLDRAKVANAESEFGTGDSRNIVKMLDAKMTITTPITASRKPYDMVVLFAIGSADNGDDVTSLRLLRQIKGLDKGMNQLLFTKHYRLGDKRFDSESPPAVTKNENSSLIRASGRKERRCRRRIIQ